MTDTTATGWRASLPASVRPYSEPAPLGALLLGISSGFPFAMIASTLTTRLAEAGIDKKAVTAFGLTLIIYNLKFLWAPLVDRGRVPVLANLIGQRRAWLLVIGAGRHGGGDLAGPGRSGERPAHGDRGGADGRLHGGEL